MTAQYLKKVEDFQLNELNRKNTYMESDTAEFAEGPILFRVGFWPAEHPDKSIHPFACLIAYTPDGWELVAKMLPIWSGELGMDTGTDLSDLKSYMWHMGNVMSEPLNQYLNSKGEAEMPLEKWQQVLALMASGRVKNGELKFDAPPGS